MVVVKKILGQAAISLIATMVAYYASRKLIKEIERNEKRAYYVNQDDYQIV